MRKILEAGLWSQNPAIVGLLGLCPLLAVSSSLINGLALAVVTTLTLTLSAGLVSILRGLIPEQIRLPIFMLILATLVSVSDLLLEALTPRIHHSIGLFIPLIVTNCVILGRMDGHAYRQTPGRATLDGLAMGLGFSWVLLLLGSIREVLGTGRIMGDAERLFGSGAANWSLLIVPGFEGFLPALMPAGAFLLLGLLLSLVNFLKERSRPATSETTKTARLSPLIPGPRK